MGVASGTLRCEVVPILLKGKPHDVRATTFFRGVRAEWLMNLLGQCHPGTTLNEINAVYDMVPHDVKGHPQFLLAYPDFMSDKISVECAKTELRKIPPDTFVWTRCVCGVQHVRGDADSFHVGDYWKLANRHIPIAKASLCL